MKLRKLLKLNSAGMAHHVILPALVMVAVAAVGVRVLTASHAATPSYSQFLKVNVTSVDTVLSRANPTNVAGGLIYGKGFVITGVQATSFELVPTQPTQGVGFYTSSGGLGAGQTDTIQTYINPNKPDGAYSGTYTLKYYVPASQQWFNGPKITYTLQLVDSYYTDYVTLSDLTTTATLSKSKAAGGLIYASKPTITALQNTSFQIIYNQPTQGIGFYTSAGGLSKGQTYSIQTYANASKPNGTYTGSATLQYVNAGNQWVNGPTIYYNITVTN